MLVCAGAMTFIFVFLPNLLLFFTHFIGIKPQMPKTLAEYTVEDEDDKPEIKNRRQAVREYNQGHFPAASSPTSGTVSTR